MNIHRIQRTKNVDECIVSYQMMESIRHGLDVGDGMDIVAIVGADIPDNIPTGNAQFQNETFYMFRWNLNKTKLIPIKVGYNFDYMTQSRLDDLKDFEEDFKKNFGLV